MLLPDEKVIMYWLSQYGVMIQEQALLLLYSSENPSIETRRVPQMRIAQ